MFGRQLIIKTHIYSVQNRYTWCIKSFGYAIVSYKTYTLRKHVVFPPISQKPVFIL